MQRPRASPGGKICEQNSVQDRFPAGGSAARAPTERIENPTAASAPAPTFSADRREWGRPATAFASSSNRSSRIDIHAPPPSALPALRHAETRRADPGKPGAESSVAPRARTYARAFTNVKSLDGIGFVAFSRDGKRVVAEAPGDALRLWSVASAQPIGELDAEPIKTG